MRIPTAVAGALLCLALLGACSGSDTGVTAGDQAGEKPPDCADCGDIDPGPPDLVGTITSIEPFQPIREGCTPAEDLDPDGTASSDDPAICTPADSDVVGTILVEELPGEGEGGRKVSFTATSESLFVGAAADGTDVQSFDDLAEGQRVRAWAPEDAACAESYPEQCALRAIDVTG